MTTERPPSRLPSWWPWALLGLLVTGAVVMLMYEGRGTSFYYDDWNFVLERRDWNTGALLRAHNEHLSLVPVLAYKLLFATVGHDTYSPYRLVLALSHAGTLVAMFVYARPRLGPFLAVLAVTTVAFYGAGAIDLLWAFQLGYSGSLLTGVLAFVALDRGTRRGDIAACVLLSLSIASSSVGLCVLAGIAIDVLGRPNRRDRWWILAIPAVLYAAWYLKYHNPGAPITLSKIQAATQFTGQGLAATVGGLAGLGIDWGRPIALAGVVLLLVRARDYVLVPWRLLALLAVPLTFWVLAAAARSDIVGAETPRYLYPTAIFVVLVAVEAADGVRLRRYALVLTAFFVFAASLTGLAKLRDGGRELAGFAQLVRGPLAALEVAGPTRVTPETMPDASFAPQVHAGPYFKAIADGGPIIGGEPAVVRSEEPVREVADDRMQSYFVGFGDPEGPARGAVPAVEASTGASVTKDAHCVRARPQGTGTLTLPVPDAGLVVAGPADASAVFRLWGDAFVNKAIPLGSTEPRLLRIPDDGADAQWRMQISFAAPLRLCGA